MKTILDLLKTDNVWVTQGAVRLVWDTDHMEWAVYELVWDVERFEQAAYEAAPDSFREAQIMVTQDESEAVAAFAKAAGIEDK